MGFFDFLRRKPQSPLVVHRLVWFELQIAPSAFRFAITPHQPMLVGFAGENGKPGATGLLPREDAPVAFDSIVEEVDALIRQLDLRSIAARDSDLAFTSAALKRPSLHLRYSYANGTRWSSVHSLENLSAPLMSLIFSCQAIGRRLMAQTSSRQLDGYDSYHARPHLGPRSGGGAATGAATVLKLKITRAGEIVVNGRHVSLAYLRGGLDALKDSEGEVWYFREDPAVEPSIATHSVVTEVFAEISQRNLPVNRREYDF